MIKLGVGLGMVRSLDGVAGGMDLFRETMIVAPGVEEESHSTF